MSTTFDQVPAPSEATDDAIMADVFGFLGTVTSDLAGSLAVSMCALGDRLGLFRAMASGDDVDAVQLAARAGVDPTSTRDWLRAMASSGYVERTADGYRLSPGRAAILADEGGPMFMCGAFQQAVALLGPLDEIVEAFRTGSGVAPDRYGTPMADAMERLSATWLDHQLVQNWIPAVPAALDALQAGGRAADIGCGSGRALSRLAEGFPAARFDGYELVPSTARRAAANAEANGVADRVRIVEQDVREGLLDDYDVVTFFDVLHDIADPQRVLEMVRGALRPAGVCIVVEANAVDPDTDDSRVATILNATSVLYCLPTSRSWGAAGLGTMGLPAPELEALAEAAGFTQTRRVPVGDPFNAVYELTV